MNFDIIYLLSMFFCGGYFNVIIGKVEFWVYFNFLIRNLLEEFFVKGV